MKKLLSIEYQKLKKLNALKIILLVYAVLSPLVLHLLYKFFSMILSALPGLAWDPYQFPDIWRFATYTSSYFNVLMGVIVVIAVTNEFSYRTFKQNVIDGLSIKEVILSKFIVVVFLSTIVSAYTFLVALLFGLFNGGTENILVDINYIVIYYLQTLCYFSFAFLFAVLLKRPAISIIFFILAFVLETIIGSMFSAAGFEKAYAFFPLNAFSKLTPLPIFEELLKTAQEQAQQVPFLLSMNVNILLSVGYMGLFFFIAYRVMKKRDL